MYALWWLDPFRIRRLPALACMLACLAGLVGYAFAWPEEAWRGYYDDGYLSKFARSGVTAVSDFIQLRLHGIGRGRDRAAQGAAAGFLPSSRAAAEHHHDP